LDMNPIYDEQMSKPFDTHYDLTEGL
jgi:hypothetical protein